MISNQILQSTLSGFAAITHAECAVCDIYGKIIAKEGYFNDITDNIITLFYRSAEKKKRFGAWLLTKIYNESEVEYIAAIRTVPEDIEIFSKLLSLQLESLIQASKEKEDKEGFYKNLLLDNLLQVDIYNKARKFQIDFKQPRVIYTVVSSAKETQITEIISRFVASFQTDILLTLDHDNQIIVHEVKTTQDQEKELKNYAESIIAALLEAGIDASVSYGGIAAQITDVSKSYKEAKLAADVKKIFYENEKISSYNRLGIGRVIYQLPLNLCRMFINEVFKGKTPEDFDEETIVTINKFFENNLNVSETSRQLFIHRNTLVYRLDKLQKLTGLDLRIFDDAITFKIALMVVKYMDYMEKYDF